MHFFSFKDPKQKLIKRLRNTPVRPHSVSAYRGGLRLPIKVLISYGSWQKAKCNFTKFVTSDVSEVFGKEDKKHNCNHLTTFRFLLQNMTANCSKKNKKNHQNVLNTQSNALLLTLALGNKWTALPEICQNLSLSQTPGMHNFNRWLHFGKILSR